MDLATDLLIGLSLLFVVMLLLFFSFVSQSEAEERATRADPADAEQNQPAPRS